MTTGAPKRRALPRRRHIAGTLAGLVTVAVLAAYAGMRDTAPFTNMEGDLLNWRYAARGPVPPSKKVALVIVDDKSIAALKGWPISRRFLAEAVNRLIRDGARAIAIDLVLTSGGRQADPAGDNGLLRAMGGKRMVVLPLAFQFRRADGTPPPEALPGHAFRSTVATPGAPRALQVQPVGVLAPSAAYLAVGRAGHVNFFVEPDGSVRWVHLALPYGQDHYPALPIELVRLYAGLAPGDMTAVLGEGIRLGERFIATDAHMRLGVNYLGPRATIRRASLIDLLEGRVAPGFFKGRAVLVGVEASGVGDAFGTPFERRFAGVALLATITDNLLEGRWLRRGASAAAIDMGAMLAIGLIVALLLARGWAIPALIAIAVAAVAVPVASQIAFERAYMWLNLAFPLVLLAALALLSVAFLLFGEHRARRRAEARTSALRRFVSPLAQRHIETGPAAGGGTVSETNSGLAIALFVDVRGFTRLSQDLAPGEVADWMRRFHRHVEETVVRHEGVVDKYIGDAVLALFGINGATPVDAARAIECAEALAGRSGALPSGGAEARLAVGLHMGPVAIEEMGGSARAEVSAAGDTVNVASRLQGLTRDLNVDVVASEAVVDAARAGSVREFRRWQECPPQALRGREGLIAVRTWTAE